MRLSLANLRAACVSCSWAWAFLTASWALFKFCAAVCALAWAFFKASCLFFKVSCALAKALSASSFLLWATCRSCLVWLSLASASLSALLLLSAAILALIASTLALASLALAWAVCTASWAFLTSALAFSSALSDWLFMVLAFCKFFLASAKLACFWAITALAFLSLSWASASAMLEPLSWANLSWAVFSSSAACCASALALARSALAWLASCLAVSSLACASCNACLALASWAAWSSVLEPVSTGISVEVSLTVSDSTLKWIWPNLSVWIDAKLLPLSR